jgi:hypothetical protein
MAVAAIRDADAVGDLEVRCMCMGGTPGRAATWADAGMCLQSLAVMVISGDHIVFAFLDTAGAMSRFRISGTRMSRFART